MKSRYNSKLTLILSAAVYLFVFSSTCFASVMVSGGEDHTMVLTENNTVFACGPNGSSSDYYYGVLGSWSTNYYLDEKVLVPVHDGDMNTPSGYLEDITTIDAGWDFVGETVNGPNDIWRMCVDDVNYPLLWYQFNEADFDCPDGVDFIDYSVLTNAWFSESGQSQWNQGCDISSPSDDIINKLDFKIFCENWLTGK